MIPFAIIADVHGNAWALEAVLADITRRGVTSIVNLGDNANGPLDPARSVALLRGCGAQHIRGNGDRMTGEGGPTARGSAVFARERLDAGTLRWLRELPLVAHGDGWVAWHASPRSDEEYLLENPHAGKTVLASPTEIAARLAAPASGSMSHMRHGTAADPAAGAELILVGHTHIPRVVRLPDGRLVVNPGSVGLPAYHDDVPEPHDVETGSPDARYALVRCDAGEWQVDLIAVPYDFKAAAAAARRHGWDLWARQVETGYC